VGQGAGEVTALESSNRSDSPAEGARSGPEQLPRAEPQEPEGKAGETFLMLDFLKDLWAFMRERKKFWLAPIILVMILLGALIVFAQGSALAPFIYTLF